MRSRQKLLVRVTAAFVSMILLAGCASTKKASQGDGEVAKKPSEQTEKSNALSFSALGGKDVMPIAGYGLWVESYSTNGNKLPGNAVNEEYFKMISEMGINYINYCNADYATNPDIVIKSLELAEKYNMGINVYDGRIVSKAGRGAVSSDEIASYIADYYDYPAFCGLYLVDEPQTLYWSMTPGTDRLLSKYPELSKALHEDLNIQTYTNMFGCHGRENREIYEKYVNEVYEVIKPNYLMFDYYVFDKDYDLGLFLWTLDFMRTKSMEWGIPYWNTIQAGSQWNDLVNHFDSDGYYPNEGQLTWNVNVSLALGAQGIGYFPLVQPVHFAYAESTEWDFERNGIIGAYGNKTRWYYYAQNVNKQIKAIDEVLMNAVSKGIIVSGEMAKKDAELVTCTFESGSYKELASVKGEAIVGCFNYGGKTAFYVVNHDMEYAQQVTLNFESKEQLKVVKNAETSYVEAETLTLDMVAGEGVLLVVE